MMCKFSQYGIPTYMYLLSEPKNLGVSNFYIYRQAPDSPMWPEKVWTSKNISSQSMGYKKYRVYKKKYDFYFWDFVLKRLSISL